MRFFDAGAYLSVAICCFSRSAHGQSPEEPLRLEYHVSAGCDDEQQFFAALRARAPRARLARSDEPARVFNVEIEQSTKGTRARLTIREPSGQRTVRDLETTDCREAVDALALIAALAVDPQAAAENVQRGSEAKSTPGDRSAATKAPLDLSTVKSSEAAPGADVPVLSSPSWIWVASVAGSGRGGVAPGLLLGGRLGIGLERNQDGWWAPSVRVAAEYATRGAFAVEGGVATFAYAAGSLEICPIRVPKGGRVLARPCITADLGVLHASGSDVPNARSASRLWLAAGGLVRLEWRFSARIGAELDIGCTFPVWRDRFRFDPRLIYEVAKTSGIAALGVTMHFP